MRRLRIVLTTLLVLILAVAGAALFLLWPEGDVPAPGNGLTTDITAFLTDKVQTDTVDVDLITLSMSMDVILDQNDITQLIDHYYQENASKNDYLKMVTGYRFTFTQQGVRLRANLNLFGFLPAQATADATLRYESRTAYITITGARLGRLNLPVDLLFSALNLKPSSTSLNTIAIEAPLPSPFTLTDLYLSGSTVRGNITGKVRSLNDLAGVIRTVAPDLYSSYRDQIQRAQEAFSQ